MCHATFRLIRGANARIRTRLSEGDTFDDDSIGVSPVTTIRIPIEQLPESANITSAAGNPRVAIQPKHARRSARKRCALTIGSQR